MRNLLIILAGLAVFALGVAGAGALSTGINADRKADNLSVSDDVGDLPPDMAVSQAALGTFRGLFVNILWQRAENLKEQGKYFDAIELGKLITRLQPRFPKVWEFVSWNMAYNISVGTHTADERWMWVKSGIDLLQRKGNGIDANPNALSLYAQLGWIYFHKVGEFQDNNNWDYKRRLATTWHAVLGAPPTDEAEYVAWLTAIRDAPDAVDGLPPGPQTLARAMVADGIAFDQQTLQDFTVLDRLANVPVPGQTDGQTDGQASAEAPTTGPSTRPTLLRSVAARPWPGDPSPQDVDAVVAFIRKKVVTGDEFNMDPGEMIKLAQAFGPVDYRQPASHTLYWSWVGLQRTLQDEGRDLSSWVIAERNVLNALKTLASAGQVVYDPRSGYLTYLPQWQKWVAYDQHYQSLDTREGVLGQGIEQKFGGGYRNQMGQAIVDAWTSGARQTSDQLYTTMKTRFQGTQYADRYDPPLDDFVRAAMNANLDTPANARSAISNLLQQSISEGIVGQNARQSEALQIEAKRLHDEYRALNPNPNDPLYKELKPFADMQFLALANFVAGEATPASRPVPILVRARVFNSLGEPQRAAILLQASDRLAQEAQAEGFNPAALFRVPSQAAIQAVRQEFAAQDANNAPAPGQPRREIN